MYRFRKKNERNTYSREGNAQNESHPKDSPHEQINEVSSERGSQKVRGDESPSSSSSVITVTFSAAYINNNRDEGTAQKTFSMMMVPQHERTRSESKEMGRVRWHQSPPFMSNIFGACVPLGFAFARDFRGFAEFGDGKKLKKRESPKIGNHRDQKGGV